MERFEVDKTYTVHTASGTKKAKITRRDKGFIWFTVGGDKKEIRRKPKEAKDEFTNAEFIFPLGLNSFMSADKKENG